MSVDSSASLPFFLDVAVGGRPNGLHLARFNAMESDMDESSIELTNGNSTNDLSKSYNQGYLFDNEKEKGSNGMNGKQEATIEKQPQQSQGSWRMEILEDGTITYSVDPPLPLPTASESGSHLDVEPKAENYSSSLIFDSSRIDKSIDSNTRINRSPLASLHSTHAIEKGVCSHYEHSGSFGQDAYAVYIAPNSNIQCLAVADGVGGWRDNNIDSGILSRALMRECVKKAPQFTKTPEAPLELMKSIYETVKSSGEVDAGSTTACILTLTAVAPPLDPVLGDSTADQMLIDDLLISQSTSNSHTASSSSPSQDNSNESESTASSTPSSPSINQNIRILSAEHSNESENLVHDNKSQTTDTSRISNSLSLSSSSSSSSSLYLHCANLGDSGYFLIRNSRVINRSAFQRDGRIVKQLAVIPPRFMGHSYCDDPPEDSSLTHCEVQDGDILIVASDGLWDNLIPPAPLFFHYIFGLMSHDGSLVNWNEQLKEKIESIVAECQWEIEREQGDYHFGSGPVDENPFVSNQSPSMTNNSSSNKSASKRNSALVRRLCDRLIHEASSFMNTMHGKPDDLTVLVAQVCRC